MSCTHNSVTMRAKGLKCNDLIECETFPVIAGAFPHILKSNIKGASRI